MGYNFSPCNQGHIIKYIVISTIALRLSQDIYLYLLTK